MTRHLIKLVFREPYPKTVDARVVNQVPGQGRHHETTARLLRQEPKSSLQPAIFMEGLIRKNLRVTPFTPLTAEAPELN